MRTFDYHKVVNWPNGLSADDPEVDMVLGSWKGGEVWNDNARLSIVGEAGEVVNAVRTFYFKPGDEQKKKDKVADELGDVAYYNRIAAWMMDQDADISPFRTGQSLIRCEREGVIKSALRLVDECLSLSKVDIQKPGASWSIGEIMIPSIRGIIVYLAVEVCGIDYDEVIRRNYFKVNSNDNHGWAK